MPHAAASLRWRAVTSLGPLPERREAKVECARVAASRQVMTWDAWTLAVLGLFMLALLRPTWSIAAQRHTRPTRWRRQHLQCAGGGVAMLTIALYLVTQSRSVTGQGYWDLVVLAVHSPFMRELPVVWVPAMCLVLLVVLGLYFLYRGATGSRGPRNSMIAIWAVNEMVICGGLLWWGVLVPETWPQASLINFDLQGLYVGFIAGALTRLVLVMRKPGGDTADLDEADQRTKSPHWLGRLRRY